VYCLCSISGAACDQQDTFRKLCGLDTNFLGRLRTHNLRHLKSGAPYVDANITFFIFKSEGMVATTDVWEAGAIIESE